MEIARNKIETNRLGNIGKERRIFLLVVLLLLYKYKSMEMIVSKKKTRKRKKEANNTLQVGEKEESMELNK